MSASAAVPEIRNGTFLRASAFLLKRGNKTKLRADQRFLSTGEEMNSTTRIVLPLLSFLALCAIPAIAVDANAVATREFFASKGSYSHDAKGLEKEWAPFLKAISKKDAAAIGETYKIFILPDYPAWFGTYFKKEDVEQLGWDYEAEAANGKHSMITMTILLRGTGFHAHCEPAAANPQSPLAPKADAVTPLQPIPVEQFTVEVSSDQGKRFSFLANYVYVDGAFRFVGGGAYPFWSMPDATSHKK